MRNIPSRAHAAFGLLLHPYARLAFEAPGSCLGLPSQCKKLPSQARDVRRLVVEQYRDARRLVRQPARQGLVAGLSPEW
jgi:hypothetical protein